MEVTDRSRYFNVKLTFINEGNGKIRCNDY